MLLYLIASCLIAPGGEPPVRPFGVPIPFAIVDGGRALTAGDVDGDGTQDVAVAYDQSWCPDESGTEAGCSFVGGADVDLGQGDGSFVDATSAPATFARAPLICDLDGDGLGDIVVRTPARVIAFLTTADGAFVEVYNQNILQTLQSMACDDLDGDGDLDLVVTRQSSNPYLYFLWNDGSGSLLTESVWMQPLGVAPVDIALGDVDGDGAVDLAWSNLGSTSASTWLGRGNGTFGPLLALDTGSAHRATELADLDDDGRDDLLLGHDGRVSAWLSRGGGAYELSFRYQVPSSPLELCVAAMDSDGLPDLVMLDVAGDLHGFAGRGNGSFERRFSIGAPYVKDVHIADVDGDGQFDLLGLGYVEGFSLFGQGVPWPATGLPLVGSVMGSSTR